MKKVLFIIGVLLFAGHPNIQAQQNDHELAKYYYQQGEYEKSAKLFKKLSDQTNGYNDYYFNQFIESLMAIEEYDEAVQAINKTLKTRPDQVSLYVTFGNLLERQGMVEEAEEKFRSAIDKMGPDRRMINSLGNNFMALTKYDLALEAFEKGEALLDNSGLFAYNIAEIYRRKNEAEPMIHYYLRSPLATIERITSVQNYFDRYLEQEHLDILRRELYDLVQEDSENLFYPEMIEWVFIKKKDYPKALRQARALDRRLEENGARIYSLAQIAVNDSDFDTGIKAYQYILDEKESSSSYFVEAKRQLLNTKRRKITKAGSYTQADLEDLKKEYLTFLDDMGRGKSTAFIMLEYAQLQGLYMDDLQGAVSTLTELIDLPGANNYVRANAKLDLGDYFLMQGEVWESTLLYSQVDKDFKEDFLGEKARFKNAKLSYYNGDFEWAQEQFDILKSATTKLISNDAIDLSVFIMDNANLDTTYLPLQMYAEAELLLFQNKREEAYHKFDEIFSRFPDHTLEDDVYFAKAQDLSNQNKFEEAIILYQKIIDEYPEDIRADNALFALAKIQEEHVGDLEAAKSLYEKLFLEYSDSTFSIESRKRYRILRGDNIQ